MPSLREQREWYGYTTGGCQIPLFDSSRLHGLDVSAKNYCTEHEFYIDVFFRHRWFHFNKKKDTHSLVQAWNAFIANILTVGRQSWLDKLDAARSKFDRSRMSVHGINCTDYIERQFYLASRGERSARVVLTAQFEPLRRRTSLISPTGGRASRLKCAKGLRIYNPFMIVAIVRSTMALHQQRVCLVVLLDETGHIHHQLGASLPAVPRGCITPPLDEITRL